jgi:predicted ATP-binding protein involved in virulence
MRIDRLGLKNFRCFDEFQLEFLPEFNMHVIVAENMAGKSALFQALKIGLASFVGAINGTNLGIIHSDHRIIGQNPISDVSLECGINIEATANSVQQDPISIQWSRQKISPSSNTRKTFGSNGIRVDQFARELYQKVTESGQGVLPLISYFGTEYVHVGASETNILEDFTALWGYNVCLSGKSIEPFLWHWYARMNDRQHESNNSATASEFYQNVPNAALAVFKQVLMGLLPGIQEVLWLTAGSGRQRNQKIPAFRFEDMSIRLFDQLSDGYQYLCLIAAELSMRSVVLNKHLGANANNEIPGVVLIDEFGIHLHPELQASTLKGLAAAFPKVQFIISTHSPMLLNSLDADQVYLLEVDAQGKRHVRHPARDLVGIGAEGILRDVFGMQSTFDVATIAAVKEHAALHRKSMSGELNDDEKQDFASLTQQLSAVAYDDSLQDPLYNRFLEMIAQRNAMSRSTQTETLPSDAEMQAMVDRLLSEMNNSAPQVQL